MTEPAVSGQVGGEPPVLVDPRRWGALIGVVGGLVFVLGYAPPIGGPVPVIAMIVAVLLAGGIVVRLYLRSASLGPFREPRRGAVVVYLCCVAGELLAIAVGSRVLVAVGHAGLRPALIAAVVGLHFVPFGWAFGERLFRWLGLALVVLGSAGLIAGFAGAGHAAEVVAVLSGLVMLTLLFLYAQGRFATPADPVATAAGREGPD